MHFQKEHGIQLRGYTGTNFNPKVPQLWSNTKRVLETKSSYQHYPSTSAWPNRWTTWVQISIHEHQNWTTAQGLWGSLWWGYLKASNPLDTCHCGNNLKADCSGFGRTDQHITLFCSKMWDYLPIMLVLPSMFLLQTRTIQLRWFRLDYLYSL